MAPKADKLRRGGSARLGRHQQPALGAALGRLGAAAHQVAAIPHGLIRHGLLTQVHVPERPVAVRARFEIGIRRRRIPRVFLGRAFDLRVQDADDRATRLDRQLIQRRKRGGQVATLAIVRMPGAHDKTDFANLDRARLGTAKHMHAPAPRRPCAISPIQVLDQPIVRALTGRARIVVARHPQDVDALGCDALDLVKKTRGDARRELFLVVQVARDQNRVQAFPNRKRHRVPKRLQNAGAQARFGGRGTAKPAREVQVGQVQKSKRHIGEATRFLGPDPDGALRTHINRKRAPPLLAAPRSLAGTLPR